MAKRYGQSNHGENDDGLRVGVRTAEHDRK